MMSTLIILFVGIFLGFQGPIWLSNAFRYFQNKAILKNLVPHDVDEKRLCSGPHSWINARTFTDKGPSSVQVCQVCGFIPSINQMATDEAIDRIQENNKIREVEDKIYNDFWHRENDEIQKLFDQEIKSGVSFEKLSMLHGAGMTFGTRYGMYKSSRVGEIEQIINKSNA